MAVQVYLVHPKDNEDDNARERIAEFIAQRGGFILMASSHGSLIAAFDEIHLESVNANYLVEFASGVTLNPNAPGAAALQQLFAANVATQLAERGMIQTGRERSGSSTSPEAGALPPGYRPLRWSMRSPEAGGEERM